jgi:hypothetical protein
MRQHKKHNSTPYMFHQRDKTATTIIRTSGFKGNWFTMPHEPTPTSFLFSYGNLIQDAGDTELVTLGSRITSLRREGPDSVTWVYNNWGIILMSTTMQAHAVKNFQIIKHFPHIQHFKIPKDLKLSKLYTSQCLVILKTGLVYIC